MTDPNKPWEPDPKKMGNWASMFDTKGREGPPPAPDAGPFATIQDDLPPIDLNEYRPWMLQRGRTRPAMMLTFRQFDSKSCLWRGISLAYPSLFAVESIGDRMITLDFGTRHIIVEGRGLDVLADHLQQGTVLAIVEHSRSLWPVTAVPIVTAIRSIEPSH